MIEKQELYELIERLPDSEVKTAQIFLQFLIKYTKQQAFSSTENIASNDDKRRISLQGVTSGSEVTEEDIVEAKMIWQ